jgi:general L-amino acid transport system permease protein
MSWLRANLFSTPLNAALTIGGLVLLYLILVPAIDWAIIQARWSGASRADCGEHGACWVFVKARLGQFIYGFYPAAERWRVDLAFVLLVVLAVVLRRRDMRTIVAAGVGYFVLAAFLLVGGALGLPYVETTKWGGLMLTLVIAIVGIAGSLPLGILLALGRRSRRPIIRALSIAYIELWRGVPLITVLFMASVMLPLFLPEGVTVDKLARALVGVVLFAAAYVAEVVRGGLQAIPKGQFEAASALGLSYWQSHGLIILPQALRIVIPGLVNVFIALLKDTTLVLIIGLFDLLGMIQAALADPNWLGFAMEGYVFAGAVFWILCFGLSRLSQGLEARLAHTTRRG